MTDPQQQAPFSARNRGQQPRIDADFPETARTGLLHLLLDLVDRDYVSGWDAVTRELQRIGRLAPVSYDSSSVPSRRQAKADAAAALAGLSWEKAYDFCERLHTHLAMEVGYRDGFDYHVQTARSEVQAYIAAELQRIFLEEGLTYEFSDGLVRRRGRKHTVDVTTRAQMVLGDSRLSNARKHYDKALHFFRHPSKPDFENAVKEAVCALEAAGKALFPAAKASTLGDLARWLSTTKEVSVPKALCQTITGVYAFRSGGDGVGHGGATGGAATAEVAEYILAISASQVIYLVDLANAQEVEVPF